jgi:hypothetical protein
MSATDQPGTDPAAATSTETASLALPTEVVKIASTALGEASTAPREPVNEWLELGSSGIHGRGGFARCAIPAGTSIIEYLGERVAKEESNRRCVEGNPYIFTINDEWDIDGDVAWNPARFLNHSCGPNCEAQQEGDRIWLVSLRDIEPGEELTFNYGYDIGEWRDYPCGCGAPNCLGFIVAEEFHEQVRLELTREIAATPTPDPGASNVSTHANPHC